MKNRYVTNGVFTTLMCLLAVSAVALPTTVVNADAGFHSHDCSMEEDRAIEAAWHFLFDEIRGPLMPAFESCVRDAELVETPCGDQYDRMRLINALMVDQYWDFFCTDLEPNVAASAHAMDATEMNLDHDLLLQSTPRIASVMAHELMHNRGYNHEENPSGSLLYDLTVPEQIEACVRVAAGDFAGPNEVAASHQNEFYSRCGFCDNGARQHRACPAGWWGIGRDSVCVDRRWQTETNCAPQGGEQR